MGDTVETVTVGMTKWQWYGGGLYCTGASDWLEVTASTSLVQVFPSQPWKAQPRWGLTLLMT